MRTHLRRRHPDIFYDMVEQDKSRKALTKELAANCQEAFKVLKPKNRQRQQQSPVKRRMDPGQTVIMPEAMRAEVKTMICDPWTSKQFSDVDVVCGVDGGVVRTHRIVLSGLSPFLRMTLLSVNFTAGEDSFLHLPDVDSRVLAGFLDKVCSGCDGLAEVDASLEFLGFGPKTFPVKRELCESRTEPVVENNDSFSSGDHEDMFDVESIKKQPPEDDEVEEDPVLVEAKEKPGSKLWKFFRRTSSLIATCTSCSAEIRTENGTTAGMATHLRMMHPDAYVSGMATPKVDLSDLNDSSDPKYEAGDRKESVVDTIKIKNHSQQKRSTIWNFYARISSNEALCQTCGGFIKRYAIFRHLREKHPDVYKQMELSRCSTNDLGKKRVRKRVKKQTKKKTIKSESESENPADRIWSFFDQASGNSSSSNEAMCKTCSCVVLFDHPNVEKLSSHLGQEHPELLNKLQKVATKPEALTERTCPDCGKEFKSQPIMLYHRKTVHSGIKPYKCNHCEMSFARPDALRHHAHVHDPSQSFLCTHCGKMFARRHRRDLHEKAVHFGEMREKCSYCDKRFQERQNRVSHERTHTGEKPYQCPHCGRQFAMSKQLQAHIRTHTGEKPYPCDACGLRFSCNRSRKNHKCAAKLREAAEQQQLLEDSSNSS